MAAPPATAIAKDCCVCLEKCTTGIACGTCTDTVICCACYGKMVMRKHELDEVAEKADSLTAPFYIWKANRECPVCKSKLLVGKNIDCPEIKTLAEFIEASGATKAVVVGTAIKLSPQLPCRMIRLLTPLLSTLVDEGVNFPSFSVFVEKSESDDEFVDDIGDELILRPDYLENQSFRIYDVLYREISKCSSDRVQLSLEQAEVVEVDNVLRQIFWKPMARNDTKRRVLLKRISCAKKALIALGRHYQPDF